MTKLSTALLSALSIFSVAGCGSFPEARDQANALSPLCQVSPFPSEEAGDGFKAGDVCVLLRVRNPTADRLVYTITGDAGEECIFDLLDECGNQLEPTDTYMNCQRNPVHLTSGFVFPHSEMEEVVPLSKFFNLEPGATYKLRVGWRYGNSEKGRWMVAYSNVITLDAKRGPLLIIEESETGIAPRKLARGGDVMVKHS